MRRQDFILLACVVLYAIAAAGCRKSAQSAAVVTPEAAPQVLDTAFQNADSNVKAEAAMVAAATKNHDSTALPAIAHLLQNSELTGQQRAALGRCLPAAVSATRAAADRGDASAAAALKAYNTSR
jgi:hypothetical protein